jgi:hypothetical protein
MKTHAPRRLDPVGHRCSCGKWACFGWGPPLVVTPVWFCPDCKPADFFTRKPGQPDPVATERRGLFA